MFRYIKPLQILWIPVLSLNLTEWNRQHSKGFLLTS